MSAWGLRVGVPAVLSLFVAAALAGDASELRVDVRAREIAPGEPLRVVVSAERPLESLAGRFAGQEIFFVGRGDTWSGWSMVGLDREAGPATIHLEGTGADGRPVKGSHAVTVVHKQFPEEHLSVAPRYVEPPAEVQRRLERERAELAEVYRSRRTLPTGHSSFVRPVPGEPTSIFGTRRLFNGEPRSPHPGLDLRAPEGTPVKSSGSGVVTLAQDLYYSGNTVIVDHGGGLFTIYAHLSEILVTAGDEITAGAVIASSGATGRVTGPHLHWGAKIGDRPFDPRALLDPVLFE